jgi:hypothetical protein
MGNFVVSCHAISVLVISVITSNDVHQGLGTLQNTSFKEELQKAMKCFKPKLFFSVKFWSADKC